MAQVPVRSAVYVAASALLVGLLLSGCSKNQDSDDADAGNNPADGGVLDQRRPADLSGERPDLTGEPMVVSGLPQNCPMGVTADRLFSEVVVKSCASGPGCHSTEQPALFGFSSAAEMKARFVRKASEQAKMMMRVSPGNIDQSYLLYKLMGQAVKAGGEGGLMPLGARNPLPAADLCLFVSWVREGAL